jgi:hypothetical protein
LIDSIAIAEDIRILARADYRSTIVAVSATVIVDSGIIALID